MWGVLLFPVLKIGSHSIPQSYCCWLDIWKTHCDLFGCSSFVPKFFPQEVNREECPKMHGTIYELLVVVFADDLMVARTTDVFLFYLSCLFLLLGQFFITNKRHISSRRGFSRDAPMYRLPIRISWHWINLTPDGLLINCVDFCYEQILM